MRFWRGAVLRSMYRSTVVSGDGSKIAVSILDYPFFTLLVVLVPMTCLRESFSGVKSRGAKCGQLVFFGIRIDGWEIQYELTCESPSILTAW